eukprot:CAMPEP_0185270670 /NCGR_PEP_ID=MMETSP1359-20130426/42830_1 /TAXON_ID=552665 /ORGANISM="Bigelowiella longifila, Strain CCMP242" /LENGTH=46 /DNA_ID= /DNA_START= /DNA_END= /DNA_ORIENTATION=
MLSDEILAKDFDLELTEHLVPIRQNRITYPAASNVLAADEVPLIEV